jgi:hypothetical protein
VPRSFKEDNWGNQVSSVLESVKKGVSWKGAAVQRGLERGSRGLATVRSHYQATTSVDTAGSKVWKLAMAL